MSILAIIPARGGSKGIPNKNIACLAGQPLISFSIKVALDSNCFSDVLVSSDSDEILKYSKSLSDQVICVKRPEEFSTDEASTLDAVRHAIDYYVATGQSAPDTVMLLQPTSPMRKIIDLKNACRIFYESDKKSLVSVSLPIQHPTDFVFKEGNSLKYCFARNSSKELRRQDFEEAWYINGAIYISDTHFLLEKEAFYTL